MMNQEDSSIPSRQGYSTIDISQRSYTEFPTFKKPNFVLHLNASRNFFSKLPNMSGFTALQDIDLSRNKFVDLSPLSTLISLRIINISNNKVKNLDFIQNLQNLEELNASNNKISEIHCNFPPNLIYVDLSFNELTSLSFLDEKFPVNIESIDVSQNSIDQIIELKYISVFQQLHTFKIGFLEMNPDLHIIPYVKYLCPSLEFFDDVKIDDSEEILFNDDDLLNILMHGSEQDLRDFLSNEKKEIKWDEPNFIPFDDDYSTIPTPIKQIEDRLSIIENQIHERVSKSPNSNQEQSQQQMLSYHQGNDAILHTMQQDISEMKQQIAQITELLYVYDRALQKLWESQ